jgi:pimeloyl-ACP methyl ester carboxylesterase
MPFAHHGGYDLWFETSGDAANRALLLVNGFGSQLVSWHDAFVERCVARGWFVIRFDNRDVGRSTKSPATDDTCYTLSEMAADAVAVLDALGIGRAHVFGVSMGGMIAQTVAIEQPERVATLTSVMSTTGDRAVGQPTAEALAVLMRPAAAARDQYIADYVESGRVISGPLFDEAWSAERAAREFDRCFHPLGRVHQMRAIVATGDRTERLRSLDVPALVIHGHVDPLIPLSGGEATAAAIPGARLLVLDEMGHDLASQHWDVMLDALDALAGQVAPA